MRDSYQNPQGHPIPSAIELRDTVTAIETLNDSGQRVDKTYTGGTPNGEADSSERLVACWWLINLLRYYNAMCTISSKSVVFLCKVVELRRLRTRLNPNNRTA